MTPDRITSGVIQNQQEFGGEGGFDPCHDLSVVDASGLSSPIIDTIASAAPFSLEYFNARREPIVVGAGSLDEVPVGTSINSLPLKFPETDFRVPRSLRGIENILRLCIAFERAINPGMGQDYAYLSLQRTSVEANQRQRSGAIHCDGLQGPRVQPKTAVEHGYVMVDKDPTSFFPGALDLSDLDVDVHDIGAAFEQRTDKTDTLKLALGTVALIDGYCIHQANPADEPGVRGFFRILFSRRQYDRTGNAVNVLFADEYDSQGWVFQPRPFPAQLLPPPIKSASGN